MRFTQKRTALIILLAILLLPSALAVEEQVAASPSPFPQGSEFKGTINEKTGFIESGSMTIGTVNANMANLKVSFKDGIGTCTFGKGGSLQLGGLKYNNIKEGGIIKVDSSGNVVEGDITSSAQSTYTFGKNQPLGVPKDTRVAYKNGVLTVYGKGKELSYGKEYVKILSDKVNIEGDKISGLNFNINDIHARGIGVCSPSGGSILTGSFLIPVASAPCLGTITLMEEGYHLGKQTSIETRGFALSGGNQGESS